MGARRPEPAVTSIPLGDESDDPRWLFPSAHRAGGLHPLTTNSLSLMLVRSLGTAAGSGAGETRPETVWLVDDATGRVVDSHPLKLAADYRPARLWQMATVHGADCCAGDVLAFYRVTAADGTVVHDGMVPGDASGQGNSTTFGGGFMSWPLVLPAGDHSVTAWLAPFSGGVAGAPRGQCSTSVTLRPLDDVALNADFPANKACTFGPASSPSPGS